MQRILTPLNMSIKAVHGKLLENTFQREARPNYIVQCQEAGMHFPSGPTDSNPLWIILKVINDDRSCSPATHTHTHTSTHVSIRHKAQEKVRQKKTQSGNFIHGDKMDSRLLLHVWSVS
jgi:hypothetical protein